MLPRFLCLGIGALALLVVLGSPNQVHAQRGRGGAPHMAHPGFHGPMVSGFHGPRMPGFQNRMMPGFHHGVFGRPFGPGPRTFNPGFRRFDRFEDRFERRFDRFEDRFEREFNRRSVLPHFNPGFFPGFVFPF